MKSYFTLIIDVSVLYDRESSLPTDNARQELAKIKSNCMLCALTDLTEDLSSDSRLSKDYAGIFDATLLHSMLPNSIVGPFKFQTFILSDSVSKHITFAHKYGIRSIFYYHQRIE